MEIVDTQIVSMMPFQVDITSVHDVYPNYKTLYTEVEAIVTVRNNDVAPFKIIVKIEGTPSTIDSVKFIENLLFELH